MNYLKVRGLVKAFGNNVVLNDADIDLYSGRITGIIGRNGSGKTILLKMMSGMMECDKGDITYNGQDISYGKELPCVFGIHFDHAGFIPELTGKKNLEMLAKLRNVIKTDDVDKAIIDVGLHPKLKTRVKNYSLGMRQRLSVAQAIMEKPDIIFLDEPMNGIDNNGVNLVRQLLIREKERGALIVIATHIKDDVVTLCDDVYSIADGKVRKIDTSY